MTKVGIASYGMGNLRSIRSALNFLGLKHQLIDDPASLKLVDSLILPGVGGFPLAMSRLRERGLDESISTWAHQGRKLVGICLGMQLLFEHSDEITPSAGLGLFEGHVRKLDSANIRSANTKLPNMGWRQLIPGIGAGANTDLSISLAAREASNNWMYFAHSYGVETSNKPWCISHIDFGTKQYVAVIQRDNVVGFQGHPELSGLHGLELLKDALTL